MVKAETIILGIILIVIIGAIIILALGQNGLGWVPFQAAGSGDQNIIINTGDSSSSPTPSPTPPAVDLRDIFQPYIVANPNAQRVCLAFGGAWHWEGTWVGCEGIGAPLANCTQPVIQVAMSQCRAVGANDVCDPWNYYCRY